MLLGEQPPRLSPNVGEETGNRDGEAPPVVYGYRQTTDTIGGDFGDWRPREILLLPLPLGRLGD